MIATFAILHATIAETNAPFARVLFAFLLGYIMVGMYTLAHELVHRRIFGYKWLDIATGYMFTRPGVHGFPGLQNRAHGSPPLLPLHVRIRELYSYRSRAVLDEP